LSPRPNLDRHTHTPTHIEPRPIRAKERENTAACQRCSGWRSISRWPAPAGAPARALLCWAGGGRRWCAPRPRWTCALTPSKVRGDKRSGADAAERASKVLGGRTRRTTREGVLVSFASPSRARARVRVLLAPRTRSCSCARPALASISAPAIARTSPISSRERRSGGAAASGEHGRGAPRSARARAAQRQNAPSLLKKRPAQNSHEIHTPTNPTPANQQPQTGPPASELTAQFVPFADVAKGASAPGGRAALSGESYSLDTVQYRAKVSVVDEEREVGGEIEMIQQERNDDKKERERERERSTETNKTKLTPAPPRPALQKKTRPLSPDLKTGRRPPRRLARPRRSPKIRRRLLAQAVRRTCGHHRLAIWLRRVEQKRAGAARHR